MSFYIDDIKYSLDELQKRIENTDLVPSRISLLKNIDIIFKKLKKQGINTLSELRTQLKTTKSLKSFSIESGLDEEYLTFLRREIESHFPKAYSTNEFEWLSKTECEKLTVAGFNNTKKIYDKLVNRDNIKMISTELKINISFLETLLSLVDLTRIQWTSPLFARMLLEAGYDSTKKVAQADAEELYNKLYTVNKKKNYFKGKIGLRDIKRLVNSAKYVS